MVRTSLCFKDWLQRYRIVNDSFVVRMAMKPSEVEVLTELCGRHRRRNNCQPIFLGRFLTRGPAPDGICIAPTAQVVHPTLPPSRCIEFWLIPVS